jgi:hypothetical protein
MIEVISESPLSKRTLIKLKSSKNMYEDAKKLAAQYTPEQIRDRLQHPWKYKKAKKNARDI